MGAYVPSGSSTSMESFTWFFWCACWNFIIQYQYQHIYTFAEVNWKMWISCLCYLPLDNELPFHTAHSACVCWRTENHAWRKTQLKIIRQNKQQTFLGRKNSFWWEAYNWGILGIRGSLGLVGAPWRIVCLKYSDSE